MTRITRKEFLGMSAAAVTSAVLGKSAPVNAMQARTAASDASRPTIIRGADILTMDPALGELPEMDVLVEDGRISAIGKDLSAEGAEIIDANGMILMPGMCDGHRHLWHTVDAGRLAKTQPRHYASYQEWKMRTIVSMAPEDHYLAGYVGGLMAIDSGVTSVIDYAHGQIDADTALAAAKGAKDSGVGGWFAFQLGVSPTYKPGDTVPLSLADSQRIAPVTEAHWETAERLQTEVFSTSDDIMQLGLAPSSGTGSQLKDIKKEWTRVRDMGVQLLAAHVHKPASPTPAGTMGYRDTGIPDLQSAGVLGPDYHLAHANRLTSEELKMLRDTGGMVCATAMGEFPYMASANRGPSVHGRARAAGVATGIGIDVNLVLTQDYFEHARAAFWSLYLSTEGTRIARDYRSDDTLDFVTALGARAMRLGDETGTITVGKRADLVLLRTDRIGFASLGSLADRVLNFASLADVDSVWVAGQARKRNGQMIGVDWAELKSRVAEAQERIGQLAASITFT
ncbi:MAG: amidohydrolase family protein [Gammaproteobacteria bacterium]|nr:amidohydrolase family protein [Gammaproteobacteria bacterium]